MIRLNQKGFTLAESLVAAGLLGSLIVAILAMVSITTDEITKASSIYDEDKMVASLVEEIRADTSKFQKNFAPSTTSNADLMTAAGGLPIAYSENYRGPVSGCPSCPGRLGFVLRTVDGFPGLFMLTIFIENPNRFPGIREYPVIVTAR